VFALAFLGDDGQLTSQQLCGHLERVLAELREMCVYKREMK